MYSTLKWNSCCCSVMGPNFYVVWCSLSSFLSFSFWFVWFWVRFFFSPVYFCLFVYLCVVFGGLFGLLGFFWAFFFSFDFWGIFLGFQWCAMIKLVRSCSSITTSLLALSLGKKKQNHCLHAVSFHNLFSTGIFCTIRSLKPDRNLLVIALISKYVLDWVNEGQATVVYPVSHVVTR